jgi:hypothetical protein
MLGLDGTLGSSLNFICFEMLFTFAHLKLSLDTCFWFPLED